MPTFPFGLFGGGAAGAGAGAAGAGALGGAGAAAGAAGGLFGVPWSIAIPILFSVLGATGIFGGGNEEEEAMKRALTMKQQMGSLGLNLQPPYQSPYMPQIDEATFRALINQMKRTSNWGWPAGMEMDTSWIDTLLGQGLAKRPWGQQLRRLGG